ncbi:MAG: methionine biosynthesis protein MetW [Gammaproteobacteria bacterium]|jgi:methionine biosynthesis protein MetW|nr:methionine biosynthesis protein MetW [Gammaproteobacteria bacterium]MBU0773210.1 methionine biosynthesis protein MetW [Gammaproteobacteria bacterium]MBU0857354.1 methionine biosynthesis protein MetW [Gammaproteobacteria bacterium]MBU1848945.1 methionine biosynthesis protein MetW [Gammaproteobacteria bacterium]
MSTLDIRIDYDVIASWVAEGARVLDLGCGDGALLRHLKDARGASGYGAEIDIERVIACMKNGINVLQIDLEEGLYDFKDQSFDLVIISNALQALHRTEKLLREMLRVGREAVVSFPNFAYWKHRVSIMDGHMPVSDRLPYQWYDTPNVRFFTIADFEQLCDKLGIEVRERLVLDDAGRPVTDEPNFLGSFALYRLGRSAA